MPETHPWFRLPKESAVAYARFEHFRAQGSHRQLRHTASHFGLALSTISEQSARFAWRQRVAAWDEHQSFLAGSCAAPERVQHALASGSSISVVEEASRDVERQFLEAVEAFRQAIEAIGRDQMNLARGMTAVSKRSMAKLLAEERTLSSRDLPAFVNATVALTAAAQSHWSKSLGVDALLAKLEGSLASMDAKVTGSSAR